MKAFFLKPPSDAHRPEGIHEAPTLSLVAIIVTAAATIGLFVYPNLAYELMSMVVPGGGQ